MSATIITIGDELLIGQVVNTNASYISKQINTIGIQVDQHLSIADDKEAIKKAIDYGFEQSSIIILTGGLGPTKDDITKKVLCEYFDDILLKNEEAYQQLVTFFTKRNKTISDTNQWQAYLPSKSKLLPNPLGTAPGMYFNDNGKHLFSLPGVPYEMERLVSHEIIPILQNSLQLNTILHQTIITQGIGESDLSDLLESFESQLPTNCKLAYLPSVSRVRLRLSIIGTNKNETEQILNHQVNQLTQAISPYIISLQGEEIEILLGKLLTEKKLTLSTAESCTGGTIAHNITAISGSSTYFKGSVVAYNTSVKETLLEVSPQIIKQETVVSESVALAMAKGVKNKLQTNIGIATTGVAGPNKGEDGKEVGTVCIAWVINDQEKVATYQFGLLTREKFIEKVSALALQELYLLLLKD